MPDFQTVIAAPQIPYAAPLFSKKGSPIGEPFSYPYL